MTAHDQLFEAAPLAGESATPPQLDQVDRPAAGGVGQDCADNWEAAAMYEQLAALSDAELTRRGLSRATLAGMCARPATAAVMHDGTLRSFRGRGATADSCALALACGVAAKLCRAHRKD